MPIDSTIWSRISQNDQEAYAVMYREYYKRFYNYGKKIISDENLIEDAAHESLLLVWEKRSSLMEVKFPGTYFYSAFRNSLITRIRQQKSAELPDASLEDPGFNAEQMIFEREMGAEIKKQLEQAILNLTPRQREAIFLRFYEGLSFEEIATVLNITTKATYKIVARALAGLKEILPYPTLILVTLFSEILNF